MAPTREQDERLLDALARYRRGQTPAQIAWAYGTRREIVSQALRRVIEQDCKHDPEARNYWRLQK